MLLKWCTQYVSKFEKAHSGHKTGKGQFPFQPQKRVTPKNIQTTLQLHLLHMLSRLCSKCFEVGFTIMWTENFQMYKLKRQKMAAYQALPSLGFSRQEYWSGLPFPSPMHESEKWKWKWSRSVVSNRQWPHGLQPSRLLHPWDFPGKSTGVGCHCLLLPPS